MKPTWLDNIEIQRQRSKNGHRTDKLVENRQSITTHERSRKHDCDPWDTLFRTLVKIRGAFPSLAIP